MTDHNSMGDIFNDNVQREAQPVTAQSLYLSALRAIVDRHEDLANSRLSMVRSFVLDGAHFTEFSDAHAQAIMPDLTAKKFMALYGDVKNGEHHEARLKHQKAYSGETPDSRFVHSPWIKNQDLLDMIGRHIQDNLGAYNKAQDPEKPAKDMAADLAACNEFMLNSYTKYGLSVPAPKLVTHELRVA